MDRPHYVVVLDDGETYSGIGGTLVIKTNSATLAMAGDYPDQEVAFLEDHADETYAVETLVATYGVAREFVKAVSARGWSGLADNDNEYDALVKALRH